MESDLFWTAVSRAVHAVCLYNSTLGIIDLSGAVLKHTPGVDLVGGGGPPPSPPPPPPDDDYDYDLPVGPNGSFASSLTTGLMGIKERQDIGSNWDPT